MADIWNKYWKDDKNHDWWEYPAPEVIEFLNSQSPELRPNVLDLGCGIGRHAIAFAKHGFKVSATDVSIQAIEYFKSLVSRLDLSIDIHACSMLEQPFQESSFDIIISYNVIYHGSKNQFVKAIKYVWHLLKPSGLFFFTCPTREDGKYGNGQLIAEHTYASSNSVTPGDVHYFTNKVELEDMLSDYSILKIDNDEGYWDNRGKKQFFSNWHVLVEKIEIDSNFSLDLTPKSPAQVS